MEQGSRRITTTLLWWFTVLLSALHPSQWVGKRCAQTQTAASTAPTNTFGRSRILPRFHERCPCSTASGGLHQLLLGGLADECVVLILAEHVPPWKLIEEGRGK